MTVYLTERDLEDLDSGVGYHCTHTTESVPPTRPNSFCGECEKVADYLASYVSGIVERHMNELAEKISEALGE